MLPSSPSTGIGVYDHPSQPAPMMRRPPETIDNWLARNSIENATGRDTIAKYTEKLRDADEGALQHRPAQNQQRHREADAQPRHADECRHERRAARRRLQAE